MGLLRLAAIAALLAGCYAPELQTCAVTCDSDLGCPDDMVCSAESMCVFSADERCDESRTVEIFVAGEGRVVDPANGIDCELSCIYVLDRDTELDLVPDPPFAYEFDRWRDKPCEKSEFACSFRLDESATATAEFVYAGGDGDDDDDD